MQGLKLHTHDAIHTCLHTIDSNVAPIITRISIQPLTCHNVLMDKVQINFCISNMLHNGTICYDGNVMIAHIRHAFRYLSMTEVHATLDCSNELFIVKITIVN